MIYFIKDTFTQAIKIGFSTKPQKRLENLQTANPYKLILLGTVPGGRKDEALYHGKFAGYRLEGEWFNGEIIEEVLTVIVTYKERRTLQRITMSEITDDRDTPNGTAATATKKDDKGTMDKDSGLVVINRIPGLRLKTFSMKLTEESSERHCVKCGVEIKYVLEFETDLTPEDLNKLQAAFVQSGNQLSVCKHTFFDEDNAFIPFGMLMASDIHVVGGRFAITGEEGTAFRVLVVHEKPLSKANNGKFKGVFTGDNYTGEHPLKPASKLIISI